MNSTQILVTYIFNYYDIISSTQKLLSQMNLSDTISSLKRYIKISYHLLTLKIIEATFFIRLKQFFKINCKNNTQNITTTIIQNIRY